MEIRENTLKRKSVLVIICLTIIIFIFVSCGQNKTKSLPIIDVHMHAYPVRESVEWMHLDITIAPTDAQNLQECLDIMDRYNVVLGLVSSWSPYIENWKDSAPGRFMISSQIFKQHLDDSEFIKQMREKCQSGEYKWIGEVVVQYWDISPDSPKMEPVFAFAEELQIPLCLHIGPGPPGAFKFYPEYRARLSSALLLEDVLIRHPNLKIWVAHAGWPLLDDMVALMYAYPQVYVDLSHINWFIPRKEFHFYLKRLINAGFEKRIMFGSDQVYWPEAIKLAIEGVESADFLTEEQKRDIFYNNAVRFLDLDKIGK